jgi:hypothetical protein
MLFEAIPEVLPSSFGVAAKTEARDLVCFRNIPLLQVRFFQNLSFRES